MDNFGDVETSLDEAIATLIDCLNAMEEGGNEDPECEVTDDLWHEQEDRVTATLDTLKDVKLKLTGHFESYHKWWVSEQDWGDRD